MDEPFLFVVYGRSITGFVTPADMAAAPARTHFYLLLAGLEIKLAELARRRFSNQRAAVDLLSPGRQDKHAERVAELRSRDKFIDEVASMSLMDLINVAGLLEDVRQAVREAGIGWQRATGGLASFRDDVMHPARPLAKATPDGMRALVGYGRHLAALTHAAEESLKR